MCVETNNLKEDERVPSCGNKTFRQSLKVLDAFAVDTVSSKKTNAFLVSTYVVCERLSVMHYLAGVVENLVQKSQFTLFWDLVPRIPPLPLKIEI